MGRKYPNPSSPRHRDSHNHNSCLFSHEGAVSPLQQQGRVSPVFSRSTGGVRILRSVSHFPEGGGRNRADYGVTSRWFCLDLVFGILRGYLDFRSAEILLGCVSSYHLVSSDFRSNFRSRLMRFPDALSTSLGRAQVLALVYGVLPCDNCR